MALKFKEGRYSLDTAKDLEKACRLLAEYQSDEEFMDAIKDMEALKSAIASFMAANHINATGEYQLIRSHEKTWALTDEDLGDRVAGHKSLTEILGKKMVKRKGRKSIPLIRFITKRVVDRERIDLAVKRGYIDLDEIAPAMMQVARRPYIRRKGESTTNDE